MIIGAIWLIKQSKKVKRQDHNDKIILDRIFKDPVNYKEEDFLNVVPCKISRIIDGDTIDVIVNGSIERIRLYGIDCPEKGNVLHHEIVSFIKQTLKGKECYIELIDIDKKWNRIVGIIYFDGQSINELLVENGYAFVYHKYCKKDASYRRLVALEEHAKMVNIGIWYHGFLQPWLVRSQNEDPNAVINTLKDFPDNLGF